MLGYFTTLLVGGDKYEILQLVVPCYYYACQILNSPRAEQRMIWFLLSLLHCKKKKKKKKKDQHLRKGYRTRKKKLFAAATYLQASNQLSSSRYFPFLMELPLHDLCSLELSTFDT